MKEHRTLSDIGETGWLALLEQVLGTGEDGLLVPLGDDAAVRVPPSGKAEILSTDVMVEGTHFHRSWIDWTGLPRRAVLAAASDIAAMGGTPTGVLLSLGFPPETAVSDLHLFADSLNRLCRECQFIVLGGDTTRSERIFLDVSIIGEVEPDQVWRQSGAEPGDSIWVTGTLGAARVFWESGGDPATPGARERFWSPPIRWRCCRELRSRLQIRAVTDLSDGLALDLKKILRHRPVGAQIDLETLPVDPSVQEYCRKSGGDSSLFALRGGEDFELLLIEKGTCFPNDRFEAEGVPVTRVGTITGKPGVVEYQRSGRPVDIGKAPFHHFS